YPLRLAALIDGDHLDRGQVVRSQAELPAQKAEGSAGYMAAHSDAGIFSQRDDDLPVVEQLLERLAHRGSRFYRNRSHVSVIVNPLHRRYIEDHLHLGIGDEAFQAVPTAGHHEAAPLAHRVLERGDHLIGCAEQPHIIWTGTEALVEPLFDDRAISRVARTDPN